jgi:hypothetical protein
LTNIKLKGINKSIYKKDEGGEKNHGLRDETSESEKGNQESYEKEEVVREKYFGFRAVIFFLTRWRIFVIR